MNKKIFHVILVVAILVFLASLMFIMGITYDYFTQIQRNQLRAETQLAAKGVSMSGQDYFEDMQVSGYRVTWIAPDGTVRYDSQADTSQMENHLTREEVREAFASGYGGKQPLFQHPGGQAALRRSATGGRHGSAAFHCADVHVDADFEFCQTHLHCDLHCFGAVHGVGLQPGPADCGAD